MVLNSPQEPSIKLSLLTQIKLSLVDGVVSLKHFGCNHLSGFSVRGLRLVCFRFFVNWLLENQVAIKQIILDYLFPESWQSVSEIIADFLFESQAKTVLGN